jgi:hypothetical protein
MATSPTSKSATTSGAAKDDVVGNDGNFTFSIDDLLKNDPGSAGKNGGFFFGSTAADQANQAKYMADHGIIKISDANGGTYSVDPLKGDFDYFVQMGNKGTWSQAHVDVADAPKPPVDTHHDGALVANWDFEQYKAQDGDNVGTPSGFWNLNQWAASNPGVYGAEADQFGFTTDIQVHGTDGHRALDTAGSPGNIFLQAIPEGRGGPLIANGGGASMPDLEAGKLYHAEVSILKQDYSDNPAYVANGTAGTDPGAWVAFQFNDKVLEVHASDIHVGNEFVTFDAVFTGREGEDDFTIMSHGTADHSQGLLIDHIQIHDWIV